MVILLPNCEMKMSLSWPCRDLSNLLSWPYLDLIRTLAIPYLDLIRTLSGLRSSLILTLSCPYPELIQSHSFFHLPYPEIRVTEMSSRLVLVVFLQIIFREIIPFIILNNFLKIEHFEKKAFLFWKFTPFKTNRAICEKYLESSTAVAGENS